VKNVWVTTPHIGSRKTAKINFTHFVGTVSGSDCAIKSLDGVRATLRMTFPPRFELRAPRFFFDLRLVAAKVAADYAECGHFGKAKFTSSGEHSRWPVHLGSLHDANGPSAKNIYVHVSGKLPKITGRRRVLLKK